MDVVMIYSYDERTKMDLLEIVDAEYEDDAEALAEAYPDAIYFYYDPDDVPIKTYEDTIWQMSPNGNPFIIGWGEHTAAIEAEKYPEVHFFMTRQTTDIF